MGFPGLGKSRLSKCSHRNEEEHKNVGRQLIVLSSSVISPTCEHENALAGLRDFLPKAMDDNSSVKPSGIC